MREIPRGLKPYLGLGLIFASVLPLSHVIAEGAVRGWIPLFPLLCLGAFLLLGVSLVLEAFVGRRFLLGLLFLFGWMFFSALAFVALNEVVPLLGLKRSTSTAIIQLGSLALGPLGAVGYYLVAKRIGKQGIEDLLLNRSRTSTADDQAQPPRDVDAGPPDRIEWGSDE